MNKITEILKGITLLSIAVFFSLLSVQIFETGELKITHQGYVGVDINGIGSFGDVSLDASQIKLEHEFTYWSNGKEYYGFPDLSINHSGTVWNQ